MKKNYEGVKRIESHYVGEDCIQIMVPHFGNAITILNCEGITYHDNLYTTNFVNKYISDDRKNQFPYSHIPTHKSRIRGKKVEFVNQLFDFEKIYIEISDNVIKENYVVKDGEEALMVTKCILPNPEPAKILNHSQVVDLFKKAGENIYFPSGGCFLTDFPFAFDLSLLSEQEVLERYKECSLEYLKTTCSSEQYAEKSISKVFNNRSIKAFLNKEGELSFNRILIHIEENTIKSIKAVNIFLVGNDKYRVETYDFPITHYSFDYIKQLEQTNLRKITEPKFSEFLNSKTIKEEGKKAKQLVKTYKK